MQLITSIKWTALSQITRLMIQLGTVFYLSRLIPPEEYGLVALSTIVMNLAYVFSDMGLAASIIHKKNVNARLLNTVYTINLAAGTIIMITIVSTSNLIESYFEAPGLQELLLVSATIFPVIAFSTVHKALHEKTEDFRSLAMFEVSANLISFIVVLLLSHFHPAAMSIVIQIWCAAFITSILIIRNSNAKVTTKVKFIASDIKYLFNYSGNIFASHLVNFLSRNIDNIVIGKVFGTATLGIYSIAYKLMMLPITNISNVIARSFFPHIANRERKMEAKIRDFKTGTFYIIAIISPAMIGLSILSAEFIAVIFDNSWSGLSQMILWLAPAAILQSAITLCGPVLMGIGKTSALAKLALIGCGVNCMAIVSGAMYDIETLIKLYLIATLVIFTISTYTTTKLIGIPYNSYVKICIFAFIPTILMSLVLLSVQSELLDSTILESLTICIVTGMISYVLFFLPALKLYKKIRII